MRNLIPALFVALLVTALTVQAQQGASPARNGRADALHSPGTGGYPQSKRSWSAQWSSCPRSRIDDRMACSSRRSTRSGPRPKALPDELARATRKLPNNVERALCP